MTQQSRRQRIESMLLHDPTDTFLRYSLAMEMGTEGDLEGAVKQLSSLLRNDPPYVPAFFMSAQYLARLEREEEARPILEQGMEHARVQGDMHAASEMGEFLAGLGANEV